MTEPTEITPEDFDVAMEKMMANSLPPCKCLRGPAFYELCADNGTLYDLMCSHCVKEITKGHRLIHV